jgi:hypothetical protein
MKVLTVLVFVPNLSFHLLSLRRTKNYQLKTINLVMQKLYSFFTNFDKM